MATVAIKQGPSGTRIEARVTGWQGHWDFYLVQVQAGSMQGTKLGEGRPHWSTTKKQAEKLARALLASVK